MLEMLEMSVTRNEKMGILYVSYMKAKTQDGKSRRACPFLQQTKGIGVLHGSCQSRSGAGRAFKSNSFDQFNNIFTTTNEIPPFRVRLSKKTV